jgi:hypothetical protein
MQFCKPPNQASVVDDLLPVPGGISAAHRQNNPSVCRDVAPEGNALGSNAQIDCFSVI